MYNDYFGFTEAPFSLTPDPRFSYTNALYQEAFATLRYGIEARKGFIVITGEAGTGKTTLLRRLMQSFGRHVQTAYIFNTHLTLHELLRLVLSDLGLPNCTEDRLEMVAQLNEYLIQQLKARNIVTLLVDEAQELSIEMLEEIRLLSNLETDTEKLLQIVLMGQPELERKLDKPELRQLKQRVALRCRLDPLPGDEVGPYIASRLKAVGYDRKDLFHRPAIVKIAEYSRGIPRLINIICDNSLLLAFGASKTSVSGEMIEEVARDLRLKDRSPAQEDPPSSKVDDADGAIQNLEGFRSRRVVNQERLMQRALTVPDFDSYVIDGEEKPVQRRAKNTLSGAGRGILALSVVLGLAAVLFHSEEMWGGLIALKDNIKQFTGFRQSVTGPEAPSFPAEEPPSDSQQSNSYSPPPADLPASEKQQTRNQNDDRASAPENSQAQGRSSWAPAPEEQTSSVTKRSSEKMPESFENGGAALPSEPALPSYNGAATDGSLELQVQKAILNRAIRGVAVSVRDGTAYLEGRVATPRQRIAASRAAHSVAGVKAVENHINIHNPD